MMMHDSIAEIKAKYSWPDQKPNVPARSIGFWDGNARYNAPVVKQCLGPDIKIAVELGSWVGDSARFILDHAPNATVIAIDHWKGSIEHQSRMTQFLPTLYETFLVNMWEYKDRLIPMRTTTVEGLYELAEHNIIPDFIYIDASHEYDDVFADVKACIELFPKARIVGDDWLRPPLEVAKAVSDCVANYPNLVVKGNVSVWWLEHVTPSG